VRRDYEFFTINPGRVLESDFQDVLLDRL